MTTIFSFSIEQYFIFKKEQKENGIYDLNNKRGTTNTNIARVGVGGRGSMLLHHLLRLQEPSEVITLREKNSSNPL